MIWALAAKYSFQYSRSIDSHFCSDSRGSSLRVPNDNADCRDATSTCLRKRSISNRLSRLTDSAHASGAIA
jgi:hypothetical protein